MAVTQAQIAKLAGVSRGTVDRALNNRGRVDAGVAAHIRQIAQELGYRPNRAGSLLVRAKRPLRLGVLVQSVETPFIASILEEIEQARPQMQELGTELIVRTMETINLERQLELLDELEAEGIDGLALAPVEDDRVCKRIDALVEAGIPVVTFNTDIPKSNRLCYVGQDNFLCGRACAGLMNVLLGGAGTVLMVTGYLSSLSQQRRIDGFETEMRGQFPNIHLLPLERCSDNNEIAREIVLRTLREHPEVRGIYFSAGGPSGACDALREMRPEPSVHFICHDLTEDNRKNLQSGAIDFLIDQNAKMQARRPLDVLLENLLTGEKPERELMLTQIDIRTRYNV